MDYTLNNKGFAKWMSNNLSESLFKAYYKIYQNDVIDALIQNQKIWYGYGMEDITPVMLKDLKAQLSSEMNSQTILMFSVISLMELFLDQFSIQPDKPVKIKSLQESLEEKNDFLFENEKQNIPDPLSIKKDNSSIPYSDISSFNVNISDNEINDEKLNSSIYENLVTKFDSGITPERIISQKDFKEFLNSQSVTFHSKASYGEFLLEIEDRYNVSLFGVSESSAKSALQAIKGCVDLPEYNKLHNIKALEYYEKFIHNSFVPTTELSKTEQETDSPLDAVHPNDPLYFRQENENTYEVETVLGTSENNNQITDSVNNSERNFISDKTVITELENEATLIMEHDFRAYLKTKRRKKAEIDTYCLMLQSVCDKYGINLFGKNIETFLLGVTTFMKKYYFTSSEVLNQNEAFAQLKQIVDIEQAYNVSIAFANELDKFIFDDYNDHPDEVSRKTVNKIIKAWNYAQTQKYIIQEKTDNLSMFSRIAHLFKSATFIGDIELSDDEYKILIYYSKHYYRVESKCSFKIKLDPFFAVILVQIGIRYYDGKDFWRYVQIPGSQESIRHTFWTVLNRYGKIHLENDYYTNILMHGFVSNACAAPKLFDNLYLYYRMKLDWNLENNTEIMLEQLLERISENKNNQYVAQTIDAVKYNPERSKEIINELLYLIDKGFHQEIKPSSTRLHALLNEWMKSDEVFLSDIRNVQPSVVF